MLPADTNRLLRIGWCKSSAFGVGDHIGVCRRVMVSVSTPMVPAKRHITRWLWISKPCLSCSNRGRQPMLRIGSVLAATTTYQVLTEAGGGGVSGPRLPGQPFRYLFWTPPTQGPSRPPGRLPTGAGHHRGRRRRTPRGPSGSISRRERGRRFRTELFAVAENSTRIAGPPASPKAPWPRSTSPQKPVEKALPATLILPIRSRL